MEEGKNKSNVVLIIIIVILLMVVLGLCGYVLYDKTISNSNTDDKSSEDEITTTIDDGTLLDKEESLPDEEGNKIVNEVFGKFVDFSMIDSQKLQLNNDNIKTFAAILNVQEGSRKYKCKELFGNNIEDWSGNYGEGSWKVENLLCSDGYQTLYDYNDVNKQYQKMFGKDGMAAKYTIKLDNVPSGAYGYSEAMNGYSFLSCECGDGGAIVLSGFKNVKKNSKILTVDYAEILADDDRYFDFSNGTRLKYEYTMNLTEEFSKYKDKVAVKYTLVFEEQEDGSYIFIKVK